MRLRHCGLVVADIEKSIEFYTQMLGFKIEKDNLETGPFIDSICKLNNTRVRTVKMSLEGTIALELLHFSSHEKPKNRQDITSPGFTHLALTVNDLDNLYDNLFVNGLEFNSIPSISPDGKAKVVFCRDPEGNLLELVEELK